MCDEMNLDNAILYADDHHGIYIPQYFARSVVRSCVENVHQSEWLILEAGPDHEHYWECWNTVCDNAVIISDGTHYRLWQDGDLWLIPSPCDARLHNLHREPTTRAQREALKRVYDRGPLYAAPADKLLEAAGWTFDYIQEPVNWWWSHPLHGARVRVESAAIVEEFGYARRLSYRNFRRTASGPYRRGDALMVQWAGMWLGIEPDGYTHS